MGRLGRRGMGTIQINDGKTTVVLERPALRSPAKPSQH